MDEFRKEFQEVMNKTAEAFACLTHAITNEHNIGQFILFPFNPNDLGEDAEQKAINEISRLVGEGVRKFYEEARK